MKTKNHTHSVAIARADNMADKRGETVAIHPAGRRRLLELQAELEKSTGQRRVGVQREIERLQNAGEEK